MASSSGGAYQWIPRIRNYARDTTPAELREALSHPLRPVSSYAKKKDLAAKEGKTQGPPKDADEDAPEFADPLGALSGDPLSGSVDADVASSTGARRSLSPPPAVDTGGGRIANTLSESRANGVAVEDSTSHLSRPWSQRRGQILSSYTTQERLRVTTSLVAEGVDIRLEDSSAAKGRLEELNDRDGTRQELSQAEYVKRIAALNEALLKAWREDRRVDSVKIAIQAAKLLGDVPAPAFYPAQWTLVTDVLDTFGRLVWQRLLDKANEELEGKGKEPLGTLNGWTSRIPESARETARNWFYKVASIRELLPRLYVEACLLRTAPFLGEEGAAAFGPPATQLLRLANAARGISNPLVAAYARCYVARVGLRCSLSGGSREHLWLCLHDSLRAWPNAVAKLTKGGKTPSEAPEGGWERLFHPALDFLLSCLCQDASSSDNLPLLEYAKQPPLQGLLLPPLLAALPTDYVAENAVDFVRVLNGLPPEAEPLLSSLMRSFGSALVTSEPSPELQRPLLKGMWRALMRMKALPNYVTAAEAWLHFAAKHFGPRELNALLEDVVAHLLPDAAYAEHYPALLRMLDKILGHSEDLPALLAAPNFLAFLELFKKDSVRVEACRKLLEAFVARQRGPAGEDPALRAQVMSLATTLHDALSVTSLKDERRAAADLIAKALDRFRWDLSLGGLASAEEELAFLVAARGAFADLDAVLVFLLRRVQRLAMGTRSALRPTKKRAHLHRALIAYAYISVPSLADRLERVRLYAECAGVALACHCVQQAEALLKAAINALTELSCSPLEAVEAVEALLSLLLLAPDPPSAPVPLFLFQGLLKALEKSTWTKEAGVKFRLQLRSLVWLSAAAQPRYPLRIPGVDSNDALYGGSAELTDTVARLSAQILAQALAGIPHANRPGSSALDLLACLLSHGDLAREESLVLAVALWRLAHKDPERLRLAATQRWLRLRAHEEPWRTLCERLGVP